MILDGEQLIPGLSIALPQVGPQCVLGIELNPYAAELARVTIWIGQIQWMLRHGWGLDKNPILQKLDQIANRDALLDESGSEVRWPAADVIVGNPPYLGSQRMLSELGENYVELLRTRFDGRVPGSADFVTYWVEKARACIETGPTTRAGLVTTNSVRHGANRKVLDRVRETGNIFEAWADEPWVVDGADVRVSLVCFESKGSVGVKKLDGKPVSDIFSDLTGPAPGGSAIDLTAAVRLQQNQGLAFQGPVKVGPFDIPGELAREWLRHPVNPNGKSNQNVLRPWANGLDISRRPSDTWIIDFGVDMSEEEAALFECPFEYVRLHVKPMRDQGRREGRKTYWWRHGETVPALRRALKPLGRFIATVRHSKHRSFVWLDARILPDSALVAVARDDDTLFGI
ncbi:MAG: class I SAM-dependent DNA methyltransferase, partial [Cyanobacteria bacterium REEB65]|nr:class I SAM-dependent DNA methyltransferase [Cyanobacteria bacterium REEB65]